LRERCFLLAWMPAFAGMTLIGPLTGECLPGFLPRFRAYALN
jgi:hypothetical protein